MALDISFDRRFEKLTGSRPFPWQQSWYELLLAEQYDRLARCNIPTGLGKTSVLALWLIAREKNPRIPRRLVYVVNRRTVVDQTTEEAKKLYLNADAAGLQTPAISTLRGQFADNRHWSADPARPAIICGTVDMIGSRLLFSGYGLGFKTRPLHAGFLGQDALLVHDEAHLEPAFQQLIEAIQDEQKRCHELMNFHVVELTATSRTQGAPFTLGADDLTDERIQKRIGANKALRLHPLKDEKQLADMVARLALAHECSGQTVLIFVRTVADVAKVQDLLFKAKVPRDRVEALTGTCRAKERDELVQKPLFRRFTQPSQSSDATVYLVCTSAGEVGVNISAQQLVTDLTTYESMAQRFGRLNRFGDSTNAGIDVVHPTEFDDAQEIERRRRKTLLLLTQLDGDASPKSLDSLSPMERQAAFAPSPEILPVTDFLFDAWSLTTIRESLPGRPLVEPYLHGRSEYEPPVTHVAWRTEVSELLRLGDSLDRKKFAEFAAELLEDYPLKPFELLRDRSDRVLATLKKLAAPAATPVWLQSSSGEVEATTLGEVLNDTKDVVDNLTVILPPEAGGLENGFFTGGHFEEAMREQYDVADQWQVDGKPMRMRIRNEEESPDQGLKLERVIYFPNSDDESEAPDAWYWYVRLPESPGVRSRRNYPLQAHLDDAAGVAQQMVDRLHLPDELKQAVVMAAKFHDLGKRRQRWQLSIGNRKYPHEEWAKSGLSIAAIERTRYRHEFGTLRDLASRPEFTVLADELQQLVLHLVAAHHGRARPHFPTDEAFDLEGDDGESQRIAEQVAVRFGRLQRTYGRWGLAYLESLVRAADILASQKVDGDPT